MSMDVSAILMRKAKASRKPSTEIVGMLLMCLLLCLGTIMIATISPTFAHAIEWVGQF